MRCNWSSNFNNIRILENLEIYELIEYCHSCDIHTIPQEVIISCQGHWLSGMTYMEVCILHLVLFFIVVSSIQGHQSLFSHSLLFSSLFSVPFIHGHRPSEKESKSVFILSFSSPSFFLWGLPAFWCYC